jgi:hypothetical protein
LSDPLPSNWTASLMVHLKSPKADPEKTSNRIAIYLFMSQVEIGFDVLVI